MAIKYNNSELYFNEQNLTPVQLGITNYQYCNPFPCICLCLFHWDSFIFLCDTMMDFFFIRNLESHAIKSVKIMSYI